MKLRIYILILISSSFVVRAFGYEKRTVIGKGEAYAPCEIESTVQLETPGDAIRRAIEDAIQQCNSKVSQISPFETRTFVDASDLWSCGLGYRYYAQAYFICGVDQTALYKDDFCSDDCNDICDLDPWFCTVCRRICK